MGTEATFIIFSSYDRRMCLLHTDTDMVISHVTYSVIITSILTLLIICLWHRLYCSLSKQNGVSKQLGVAQVLKPPSFCCLYFAFTGNQCLYSACVQAMPIFWGDSQIFQLLPSLAYSVSRDKFILVKLHRMPCYLLSKVTCYVSCENCDSSYFKWFLHLWLAWSCLPCVSHIITPCSDHWNAMCASVKSRQWNRSSMYQNKLYFFQWRDRERSCSRILFPWHYNLPHHGAMSIG